MSKYESKFGRRYVQVENPGTDYVTFACVNAIGDTVRDVALDARTLDNLIADLTEARDALRRKPQKFTVEIEVPAGYTMNIHQAKNHLRKYVAGEVGVPTPYVSGTAKEVSAA